MPKGQNLIQHVKITNTSSGKVVTLDGDEAGSVIGQIDNLTVENRNKAYIRYQDPATKSQVVLELCCVEIERLPNTEEEYDARECELDCCEQQFFGTFKTSVNQQTGEFPKKSQPSVPDKPSTPDKPKEDTPTKPSDNGSTDSGSTTPSQPNENTGTDNGNVTPSNPSDNSGNTGTNPSTPSENTGNTDNGGSTDSGSVTPSQPSDNTGNTDNGNSGSAGTTEPTTPSENGNTGTDTGTTQPSENSGTATQPDAPTVYNTISLRDMNEDEELFQIQVKGKVGEQVRLGDLISKMSEESRNYYEITEDGKLKKDADVFTLPDGQSSVLDYVYTIKENGHEESIQLKSKKLTSSENTGSGT